MKYKVFNNYLNEIINGSDVVALLETHFKDKHHNLRRWLNGKPCVFTSDRTGKLIDINVGRDREALYLFLMFCKKIEEHKEITDDFRDYLAIVIARSCISAENWEES